MGKNLYQLVCETPDVYLIHIYPAINPELYEKIEALINDFSQILAWKEVYLTRRGLINCKLVSYSWQGDWIGSRQDGFAGLRKHAKKSLRGEKRPTRVYIVRANNIEKMIRLKAAIREIVNAGTWPVHITDTQDEAKVLSQIYFNDNARLIVNGRNPLVDLALIDERIDELKQRLLKNNLPLERICLTGSTTLALAGIRSARDFDYLALDERYECIHNSVFSPHDSQLLYYPVGKEELILNSDYHFIYRDVKFASLEVCRAMKIARHEWSKDYLDRLRIDLFMLKVSLLSKLISFRYIV